METDGDEGESNPNVSPNDSPAVKPFRIEIYPQTFAGPFVVYFRKNR